MWNVDNTYNAYNFLVQRNSLANSVADRLRYILDKTMDAAGSFERYSNLPLPLPHSPSPFPSPSPSPSTLPLPIVVQAVSA